MLKNSYLESSAAASIKAINSLVFHVLDKESIRAEKEIVCDVYRPGLEDRTGRRSPFGNALEVRGETAGIEDALH